MTATLRSRSFVATVLAVTLMPGAGLAAQPAQPNPATQPAPASPGTPTDAGTPAPGDAPTDASETPAEGEEAPAEVPVEEAKAEEEKPAETTPPVPEGPERPPEPTLGNGKFKAKGTGLMIAGGTLLGLGVAGVLTSFFLTRCPDDDLDKSFACRNRQHNTFAVPATGAAALLGAVLLAVGVTYRVRYKRWESWDPTQAKTAIRPSFSASGVGFKF
jgi:hypothetical protein